MAQSFLRSIPSAITGRLPWVGLAAATVALGLLVRAVLPPLTAKYAGVALYAVMMVWLVKAVRPGLSAFSAAVTALLICFAVEALQATGLPRSVNSAVPGARLVLGEVFSWWDLPAYAGGVGVAWAIIGMRSCASAHRP